MLLIDKIRDDNRLALRGLVVVGLLAGMVSGFIFQLGWDSINLGVGYWLSTLSPGFIFGLALGLYLNFVHRASEIMSVLFALCSVIAWGCGIYVFTFDGWGVAGMIWIAGLSIATAAIFKSCRKILFFVYFFILYFALVLLIFLLFDAIYTPLVFPLWFCIVHGSMALVIGLMVFRN